jgi:hypothetical protein
MRLQICIDKYFLSSKYLNNQIIANIKNLKIRYLKPIKSIYKKIKSNRSKIRTTKKVNLDYHLFKEFLAMITIKIQAL